jgi:excisionase family DNA binding protein
VSDVLARLVEELAVEVADRAEAIVRDRLAAAAKAACAPEYLTVVEAAEVLRCSRQRVYDLVSSRRLTKYRDGSRVLVRRADLDEYLANGRSVDPPMIRPRQGRMNTGATA